MAARSSLNGDNSPGSAPGGAAELFNKFFFRVAERKLGNSVAIAKNSGYPATRGAYSHARGSAPREKADAVSFRLQQTVTAAAGDAQCGHALRHGKNTALREMPILTGAEHFRAWKAFVFAGL
ncbi:hypothetical protein [uncultured Desulfovibrio sp.]|uniref:hypothetical protein n=1 Tax=uncultured Desulfovibrio sp. TaxID=167968 RepID=UPI00262B280F|nr:hypothetical protein [uncultured Desulfovibrio sp.]